MSKNICKQTGDEGEEIAVKYLVKNGYKIINRNYRSVFGEIDIIASRDQYIIFVEVKARSHKSWNKPAEVVSKSKQIKIIKTAMMYLSENQLDVNSRFDVIEIFNINGISAINHIKSAFIVEDEYGIF